MTEKLSEIELLCKHCGKEHENEDEYWDHGYLDCIKYLKELKEMHSTLREIHKGWRRKLQRQVERLQELLYTACTTQNLQGNLDGILVLDHLKGIAFERDDDEKVPD